MSSDERKQIRDKFKKKFKALHKTPNETIINNLWGIYSRLKSETDEERQSDNAFAEEVKDAVAILDEFGISDMDILLIAATCIQWVEHRMDSRQPEE